MKLELMIQKQLLLSCVRHNMLLWFWFQQFLYVIYHFIAHPNFKKGLRDMEVTEGGMLKLQVTCYGSPIPEIKWFKDGKEVRSDAHIKISKDKKRVENFSLTVNLVKVEDGGEYEVRATNEMGTAVTKSIVNILGKLTSTTIYIIFQISMKLIIFLEY